MPILSNFPGGAGAEAKIADHNIAKDAHVDIRELAGEALEASEATQAVLEDVIANTTPMYGTEDLVAGVTPLATGRVYYVIE